MSKPNLFLRIFDFYVSGFKEMTWGRKLWIVILIKLFIFFVVLKVFFFHNKLEEDFNSDQERGDYVIEQLITPK